MHNHSAFFWYLNFSSTPFYFVFFFVRQFISSVFQISEAHIVFNKIKQDKPSRRDLKNSLNSKNL